MGVAKYVGLLHFTAQWCLEGFTLVPPLLCHVVCSNPLFKSGSLRTELFMGWKSSAIQEAAERQRQRDREKIRGKQLLCHSTGASDSNKRKGREKQGVIVGSQRQSSWCVRERTSYALSSLSVCCHSLSLPLCQRGRVYRPSQAYLQVPASRKSSGKATATVTETVIIGQGRDIEVL